MFKFLKSLPIFAILLFAFAGDIKAQGLFIKSIDMPDYINKEPFNISYTVIQIDNQPVHTIGYIKKDGSDWKTVGESDKLADSFKVDSGFLSGDGVYKIHFSAKSGSETADSGEESFNIDFTAPDPVSNYSKSRIDAFVYKICWTTPNNDDFNRTIIYRSDQKEFTADSSTQITEVSGAKNTNQCFEDHISQNKDYFYVTRTVDNAGNVSSVRGDSEIAVTVTSNVLGAETKSTTSSQTLSLPTVVQKENTDEVKKEGEIGGAGSTQIEEEKTDSFNQNFISQIKRLGKIRIIGIFVILIGLLFLIVALIKKKRQ